jgi:radical SAM protein with 4Fe4S-binding SPASM domain
MNWAYDLSQISPFAVATTEAPSYRRVALERMRASGKTAAAMGETTVFRGFGIRDGHGIVFISNQGDIYPAGFLPLAVANVRTHSLVETYRESPLFRALHNPAQFRGKCGTCEFAGLCGGSRARAFAATGDPLGSDPLCSYEPKGQKQPL